VNLDPVIYFCAWTVLVLGISFYMGRLSVTMVERNRCAKIAREAGDFCRRNATRPPIDALSAAWAARHDEARLIEKRIRDLGIASRDDQKD
jgi:hypothetical protein